MAEAQDYYQVQRIFQWRNAAAAIDLYRDGKRGNAVLAKNPALTQVLVEMRKVQLPDEIPAEAIERAIQDEMEQMTEDGTDGVSR